MTGCLLWSVPNGASSGNMLRSGVLQGVLDAAPDARVVLLSPLAADPGFLREFAGPRVIVEALPPHVPDGIERRLLSFIQARYLDVCQTDTLRMVDLRFPDMPRRYWRTKAALGRLAAPRGPAGAWYDVSDRVVRDPALEAIFDRHAPTVVAAASPGLILAEIPVLRTARRRSVPSLAVDLSWDNLTNKLHPPRQVDRLVVWNASMRDEARDLHGVDADRIAVAGVPQFDTYFREARSTREAFCRRTGLDPARKIITLATIPSVSYPYHVFVAERLARAIASGAVAAPSSLLVRVHPRDDARLYADVAGHPHVVVEKPFHHTEARSGDGLDIDFTAENTRHLADTMCHSDVVLNVASTIAIEASIFDTPVVNLAFDDHDASGRDVFDRHYKTTHYQKVVRSGAVRIARSTTEMIELVNRYLADSTLDADGRRRIVEDQCAFTDGASAARVAREIVSYLASPRFPR